MSKFFKLISYIIIWFLIFSIFSKQIFADYKAQNINFIVTAYYSPLPNQKHYITWSYYWDKRLNWEGHTTASWKKSFVWMLAAPKKYPFWTKIYFEWYWVWVVEDRGWAIVKAWLRGHKYDRIDIWMWYGDEWLQRAIKWWKRTIKWRVVSTKTTTSLKFSQNILFWIKNIKVNPEIHNYNNVKILEENLKKLWIYNWKIDWKYFSIKNILINYQIKNKIIKSKYSPAAWWFWPKTYLSLLRKYWNKNILIKQNNLKIIETNPKIQIILKAPEIELNWDKPQIKEVKKVQELFKKLWLYSWKINWNYNSIKNKILEIQKEAWLIKNNNSWWAWYFWEKTKAWLITYCENKFTYKKIYTNRRKNYNSLNNIEKEKLNMIVNKINRYIKIKWWIDNNKKLILKKRIEKKLLFIKEKTNKEKLKIQILYIIENI